MKTVYGKGETLMEWKMGGGGEDGIWRVETQIEMRNGRGR